MVSFHSGDGTVESPYVIFGDSQATVQEQLQLIGDSAYVSGGYYFILGEDVDLSNVVWTPIGTDDNPFTGVLDGNGYSIKNLSKTYTGVIEGQGALFKSTNSSTIKNMCISGFNLYGSHSSLGNVGLYIVIFLGLKNTIIDSILFSNCTFTVTGTTGSNGGWCGVSLARAYDTNSIMSNCEVLNCSFLTKGSMFWLPTGIFETSPYQSKGLSISNCYCGDNVSVTYNNSRTATGYEYSLLSGGFTNGSISNCVVISAVGNFKNRIGGTNGKSHTNNYCNSEISGFTPIGANTVNGADVSYGTSVGQFNQQGFWDGTDYENTGSGVSWDFTNTWKWNSETNLPELRLEHKPIINTPIKVNGTWRDGAPYTKINGVWKKADTIYVKVNGVWKQQT